MTIYDSIRQMHLSEMADFLSEIIRKVDRESKDGRHLRCGCAVCIEKWLSQEVTDGTHSPLK